MTKNIFLGIVEDTIPQISIQNNDTSWEAAQHGQGETYCKFHPPKSDF